MKTFNPEDALCRTRREFGEHGGVTPSIERSSTFTVLDPKVMPKIFEGKMGPDEGGCFLYSRHFNPTVDTLARYLAAMEGTEHAICTASGISAIACAVLQLCKHGDHIVSSNTIYGGTHALFAEVLPQMGISTTFVDISDLQAVEKAITKKTKLIYAETIGNPTLRVSHIPALSKIAKQNALHLVIDNTFSPMMISPAKLGADIVIHSLTKFINGASDIIGGVICATKEFCTKLMDLHTGCAMLLGPTMDPRVAFDVIQRLPHLAIRMREHSHRALALAERLEQLDVNVIYPGLKSHPQHALLTSMLNETYGYGGLLAIECGSADKADELLSVLQNKENFGLIAVSLGYYDTLMTCSSSSTASEIAADEQQKMGLTPSLIRIAVGYTGDLNERLAQMERAVKMVGLVSF